MEDVEVFELHNRRLYERRLELLILIGLMILIRRRVIDGAHLERILGWIRGAVTVSQRVQTVHAIRMYV